ncbi:sulfotransferase domain-containing protein [Bradyrhizobium sp. HKCCYLR20261]|uniref:sulfotransferase domain-containing protein n=1 Tax=Bradyrhizobium sp. HKCCYLR20261 TaxID=3420760 RepID=UPI003EB8A304
MEARPDLQDQARQAIWDFLLQRRSSAVQQRCYLVSYPRSGNTLVRAYFAILQGRPQLSVYAGDVVSAERGGLAADLDGVDLIKTHQIPAGSDPVIYLVRDGRNATLSFLQMSLLFGGHDFQRLDQVHEAIQWLDRREGSWSDHVSQALAASKTRRVMFVRYEDLIATPEQALDRMIRFIGRHLPAEILTECVNRQRLSDRYAENPYNGFTYQPRQGSIFELLQRYRNGSYWRHILDDRSKRYFHETGATAALLQFGYEDTDQWWKT